MPGKVNSNDEEIEFLSLKDGINWNDLSNSEKRKFNQLQLPVIITKNKTQEECQQIFTDLQYGKQLTNGEKIHALQSKQLTKQLIEISNYELENNKTIWNFITDDIKCNKRYDQYTFIGVLMMLINHQETPITKIDSGKHLHEFFLE